jgi:hypothetical protein
LLVVLALMAVVSAVVVPSIVALDAPDSGGMVIRRFLLGVRAEALARGRTVSLIIDPATKRFWLDAPDTNGVLPLPESAELSSAHQRVHFRFFSTGGASGEALIVREGDRSIAIQVNPFNGVVSIHAQ